VKRIFLLLALALACAGCGLFSTRPAEPPNDDSAGVPPNFTTPESTLATLTRAIHDRSITNFGQAEIKMIKYVESHAAKCGIPPQVSDQLKLGHKNTESMKTKVCAVAQQMQQREPAGPSLSEVLGSPAAIPEATPSRRRGGSIFDTLEGNVLERTAARTSN